jgi:PAS domain S-box-containing protein
MDDAGAKTILLVDDEAVIAMSEAKRLEKNGYTVLTAFSGASAIEKAASHSFIDLILMDIDLGSGMDGTQCAEMILKTTDIPVLFLSNHTEPEIVDRTEKITSYGYVVKNSGNTVLLASIRMAFKLHEAHRELRQREEQLTRTLLERKQAEEALKKSETILRGIYQASSAGIGLLTDRKFLSVNRSLCKISGYSEEELLGKTTRLLYADEDEFVRLALLYKDVERDGFGMTEARIRRKDDKVIPALISLSPVNPDDLKGSYIVTVLEITDLKRAEDALRASEEKYRTLVDNMQDAVYRCDLNGNIVFTTPSAARLLGYSSAEELIGMNWGKDFYYRPEDREKLLKILDEQGKVTQYEITFKRKDNELIVISTSSHFYRDRDGKIFGIEGVFSDITGRKRVEEEIKKSEARLKRAQTVGRIGYSEQLIGSNETWASAEGMALYGFPPVDGYVSDDRIRACITDLAPMRIGLTELLERGKRLDVEFAIAPADGSPRRYIHTVSDLERDESGKPVQILSTFQDVTESVLAKEALKRSEEQFRGITQNIPGIVYQLSLGKGGEIIANYFSENTMKYTGLDSRDPDIVQRFVDGISREDRVAFMTARQNAIETMSTWEWEGKYTRPDGQVKYFHGLSQPRLLNEEVVFDGIILDITESKRAEKELADAKVMLDTALMQTPIPMVIASAPDCIVRMTNSAGLEYLGIQDEPSHIGESLLELSPTWQDYDEDGRAVPLSEMPLALALRGIETKNAEYRTKRKDGTIRWNSVSSSPVRNGAGDIIAAYLVFPDITERKLAVEALLRNSRETEWLMKSMANAFVMWETVFDESHRIIDVRFAYINDAYERFAGIRLDDVRGKKVTEVFPKTEQSWFDIFNEIAVSGSPKSFEMFFTPTGRLYSCTAYLPWETADRVCVVFDDITERRKAEEDFKRLAGLHQIILDTVTVGLQYLVNHAPKWTNAMYDSMFGGDFKEITHDDRAFNSRDDLYEAIENEAYPCFRKNETYLTELKYRRKDDSVSWYYLACKAINPNSVSDGSLWMLQDITNRRNAELALRKSESILKATMESINDGILVVSSDDKITHMNTRFKEIFSIPDDLLSARDDRVLLEFAKHKLANPEGFARHVEEIYRTSASAEDILDFADGHTIERYSFPLSEDSPIAGRVWSFRDITERMNAAKEIQKLNAELEDKVRERTEQLESANEELEATNESLRKLNVQIENSYEELNFAQEQLVLSEKMAALGRLIAGIGHELNTPLGAIASSNNMIMDTVTTRFADFPVFCSALDKESLGMLVRLIRCGMKSPLLEDDAHIRKLKKKYNAFFERGHFKNSRIIAEWLVDIGCAMDEMELSMVAKNARFEDILEYAYSIMTVSRSSFIIELAAKKAESVVNTLRTYTTHSDNEALIETDIVKDIEMALALYHNKTKHGVRIIRNYEGAQKITCYPERLGRVWVNLINNALQAMEYNGVLIIEIKADAAFQYVSICDNGPGIPEEIKGKIFTPFFTTKIAGEGSGLGLDICRRILGEIGGAIGFESSPGKTVFTVTLRLAKGERGEDGG